MIFKRVLLRISVGLDRISGDSQKGSSTVAAQSEKQDSDVCSHPPVCKQSQLLSVGLHAGH